MNSVAVYNIKGGVGKTSTARRVDRLAGADDALAAALHPRPDPEDVGGGGLRVEIPQQRAAAGSAR
jgi:hypothetical protein